MPTLSPEPPHYHVVPTPDRTKYMILHEVEPGTWETLPGTYTRRHSALTRARNLYVDERAKAEAAGADRHHEHWKLKDRER